MKLKSLNKYIGFIILIFSFLPLNAEEEIDIWNKEKKTNIDKKDTNSKVENKPTISNAIAINNNNIKIENEILDNSKESEIFGIYDPAESNFNLNMWSQTSAENVRSSIKRINKIKLSGISKNYSRTHYFLSHIPHKVWVMKSLLI